MKIIHTADLHLNSPLESNYTPRKAKQRRQEMLDTFASLADYARKNGVRAIFIAGDMFDTSRPDRSTFDFIHRLFSDYSEIDFLYFAGNHDESLQFENEFEQNAPENLKVFGTMPTSFFYDNICITGTVGANCRRVASTLNFEADKINILVMHGQIGKGNDCIDLSLLASKNIDYLALGHVHFCSSGQIDKRGKYCYCGCLEGRGFDECGQKGFVLLDIEERVKPTFVPFARRTIHEISVDITNLTARQIEDEIDKLTQDILDDDIVKLNLTGDVNLQSHFDKRVIAKKLADKFFASKTVDKTKLQIDISEFADEVSLRGEFVRLVKNSDLDEQMQQKVILCGIKALRGDKDVL